MPNVIAILELGSWSWQGGTPRPCHVVVVNGRVWGAYCYRGVAEAAAARITPTERVDGFPLLADYTPPEA